MDNLLRELPRILSKAGDRDITIFLDFDGTLAPIADTPGKAVMPDITRQLLRLCAAARGITVAIISGREISDLMARAGVEDIIYSGSHGAQLVGPGIRAQKQQGTMAAAVRAAFKELKKRLRGLSGVIFEDKRSAFAVHYRLAGPAGAKKVREAAASYMQRAGKGSGLALKKGKKVVEITAGGAMNKGTAVRRIIRERKLEDNLIFYLGDDITDRDAFRELKGKGVPVYIGKRRKLKYAQYRLTNNYETAIFLRKILSHKGG